MARKKKADNGRSIAPMILQLERLYDHCAKHLDWPVDVSNRPAINVMPAGRKRFVGWFDTHGWTDGNGGSPIPEINITAERLRSGIRSVAGTMIHEMVHYANFLLKVRDCSSNQYHNKAFLAMCQKIGLECEKMDRFGWAATSMTDKLIAVAQRSGVDWDAFKAKIAIEPKEKAPTKMKKWTCGCTIVRCAVELEATCEKCGEPFEMEDVA